MKKVYINSVGAITSQKTFDNSEFLNEIVNYTTTHISVVNPNYKEYLDPGSARRMAKGIKMGVAASKIALQEAGLDTVDAVITGSGMGCVIESERFVAKIIDNNEAFLTPTSFIQSTHNTVGGQIALGLQCKGYNFTYVHSSSSFEAALMDAKLQLALEEISNILVGGVDELGPHMIQVHGLINHIKQEEEINNLNILSSGTPGAVFSEGASFMVVSNILQETTYAEILAIEIYNTLDKHRVEIKLQEVLKQCAMTVRDIDVVILGNNGDIEFDDFYTNISNGVLAETQQVFYKHLTGEYKTVSAFGVWLGAKILKTESIPSVLRLNDKNPAQLKNILIYNQYRGENHTFVMLRKC